MFWHVCSPLLLLSTRILQYKCTIIYCPNDRHEALEFSFSFRNSVTRQCTIKQAFPEDTFLKVKFLNVNVCTFFKKLMYAISLLYNAANCWLPSVLEKMALCLAATFNSYANVDLGQATCLFMKTPGTAWQAEEELTTKTPLMKLLTDKSWPLDSIWENERDMSSTVGFSLHYAKQRRRLCSPHACLIFFISSSFPHCSIPNPWASKKSPKVLSVFRGGGCISDIHHLKLWSVQTCPDFSRHAKQL